MATLSGAKRKRGLEEEEEDEDRISRLPDGILGDIVSLLPTNDGARTQVLSSRWRHIWRSAPLNINLENNPDSPLGAKHVTERVISRILSAHQGPCRRFSIPKNYLLHYRDFPATSLDSWLESPTLNRLQELEFHYAILSLSLPLPPLPASIHRFSSTLHAASFGGCGFTDGNNTSGLHFPVLKQLSLEDVRFSESSLRALLAACPVLQSLLLRGAIGFCRFQIASPTLRSIGLRSTYEPLNLRQLIIEDAPCLERLLSFNSFGMAITISVISAPKLIVLGPLSDQSPTLEFGTTVIQGGSGFVSLKMVVHSVKVLSLFEDRLSLDVIIKFMKCFPCLERLYIQTRRGGERNLWCHKYKNLIGTLDIRLKKIVLAGYRGSMSHVNFAKFFVLNARMLESMKLELCAGPDPSNAWIDKQHRLLQTKKKKASRDMQLDFVPHGLRVTIPCFIPELVHDLSTADPFPDRADSFL